VRRALIVVAVAGLGSGSMGRFALAGPPAVESRIVVDGPTAIDERKVIAQAMRLLARLPERVAVIDAEQARPDVKATLLRLDAFTIKGSRVVYLVRQSALLQAAVQRQAFYTHALASVIWHEMAHIEGADEREARRREQSLWTTFVRDQRVDEVTALRYLEALTKRPDAQLLRDSSERTTVSPEKIINTHKVRPESWPRLHVPDPVGRQVAGKALALAWERLAQPDCGALLMMFNDQAGRPLTHHLAGLSVDLQTYLTMLVFIDGSREAPCVTGTFAFTAPGSRVIRLCVEAVKRTWFQDQEHTVANFIHEMLHTLGLGENPPSSPEITRRVDTACRPPASSGGSTP